MHQVGVIGCGYWGPNLVRNCQALPDVNVKYVCDRDDARLSYMTGLYPGVASTADYQQVLGDEEIDAVFIATPVATHSALGLEALEAGKHTFIEKPLAPSVDACTRMIATAEKRSLQLMVGHTFIYSEPVRAIKRIIDSGEIGEVMYIGSRRLNLGLFQKDINVAWDLAPHDLSIIFYLLDQRPISVNCQGLSHFAEGIEDVTTMTLTYGENCLATVQSSWLDPKKIREITIVGTKKMVLYDDTEPLEKIKIYDKSVSVPPHYDTFAEFQYSYNYGDVNIPYVKQVEPLRVEAQHFFDCIDGKDVPMSSGRHGRDVVAVLEAASQSLKQGGAAVPFRIDSEH